MRRSEPGLFSRLGGMASRNPKATTAALVASFVLMMLLSGSSSSNATSNNDTRANAGPVPVWQQREADAITKKVGGNGTNTKVLNLTVNCELNLTWN